MTTDEDVLHPRAEADLTDCSTFLHRLVRLDPSGLVRVQRSGEYVTFWAQPLGVVLRHDVRADTSAADRTVAAAALLAAVDDAAVGTSRLGPAIDGSAVVRIPLPMSRDVDWRGSLPPRRGWSALDAVPVAALRGLAGRAGDLVRAHPDPAAAAESLLDQEALRVSGGAETVLVPLRTVAVLSRMGFLGADGASTAPVRVACTPSWARLAARHGTVYQRRTGVGLSLA